MIRGIEHIGLCAKDPESLSQWYVKVLNYKVVHSIQERKTFFVEDRNGGMLEIYPANDFSENVDNVHSGLRHLGISVVEFDVEVSNLKKLGVDIPENKIVRTREMKLAFFNDIEGNLLHFVERPTPITKRFW
jgi:glyoxylase I family protein